MFKAITTVAALVIATSAMAQDDLTISSLAKGETTKAAFNQMVQGHKLPAWVMKGGTYTPAQTVTLGDETYQVMSACKPHDCNFAFFSGLIGAQFWAERVQPKSPELDAKLLVSC
ncbi:Ivy family c-type lysozyme inhibitor [Escherichia coli]|uniref:Ivy family c-type lysozyme inhibitor n=1 Tax=Escherichia coli TaxID=562 RepID=UPI003C2DF049